MLRKLGPYFFLLLLFCLFYPGNNAQLITFAYANPDIFTKKPYILNKLITVPTIKATLPYVSAESLHIIHVPTGTTLIKMLTALTAKRLYDTGLITSINQATPEGQIMGLQNGEKISIENLLYATLIYSANDAAEALAHVSSREAFLEEMRITAKSLDMQNTTINNPTGLDDDKQLSTAEDLTKAASAILADSYLSKITMIKDISLPNADFSKYYTLTSTNVLLGTVAGVGGLKTGYTEKALQNLISFVIIKGEPYIITLLKSNDRFTDTKVIVEFLKNNIQTTTFDYSKIN
jgi:serine-type D-Ala-D-Ala carboxypeptidase (penicillin-binding protein 5/6)